MSAVYGLYLSHVINNASKRQAKLAKYAGTPYLKTYEKIYSKPFLIRWILVPLSFAITIIYDVYKALFGAPDLLTFLVNIITTGMLIAGFVLINRVIKRV